jgi:glycosyltransferase involved in cell wall biosynthesis
MIKCRLKATRQKPSVYYRRAKATLLTSFFEGFPNVLVESIALGTPVISFDCPSGPADIIIPGVNGILVPNQDIQGVFKSNGRSCKQRNYI